MASRKVNFKMEKMSETDLLKMVAKSTDNGFPVPVQTVIDASNRKTVAKMFDSGLILMNQNTSGWITYTISDKGREAIAS